MCVLMLCQSPGGAGPSWPAVLHLPGPPGLDAAALQRTQRQAAHGELRQRPAQRECCWPEQSQCVAAHRRGAALRLTAVSTPGAAGRQCVSQCQRWKPAARVRSHARGQKGIICTRCALTGLYFNQTKHCLTSFIELFFSCSCSRFMVWKTPECPNSLLSRWMKHIDIILIASWNQQKKRKKWKCKHNLVKGIQTVIFFPCSFWKPTRWREVWSCWRSGLSSWAALTWETSRFRTLDNYISSTKMLHSSFTLKQTIKAIDEWLAR